MASNKKWLFAGILAAGVGLAAGLGLNALTANKSTQQSNIPGFLWPQPKTLRAFTLSDQHERPFDLARLQGKWTFFFFGYTHCPDVCPVTLAVLQQVAHTLKAKPPSAADVQVAFVSVDPERDTAARLGDYVRYFDETFLGVSGPPAELERLTRQLGIVHLRSEPSKDGSYLVDHTASVLLTDPKGRWVAVFGAPHSAQDIAERYQKIRAVVDG